jgi:hypothetical protein
MIALVTSDNHRHKTACRLRAAGLKFGLSRTVIIGSTRAGIGKMQSRPFPAVSHFDRLTTTWYHPKPGDKPNVRCDENSDFCALRDIKEGDELTVDTNTYSDHSPSKPIRAKGSVLKKTKLGIAIDFEASQTESHSAGRLAALSFCVGDGRNLVAPGLPARISAMLVPAAAPRS